MDGAHFASLVRSLSPSGDRRGALTAVLGDALGALRLTAITAKQKHKKKHKKKCGCPGGRTLLSNRTCATVCADEDDCALLCVCALPSVEGRRFCRPPLSASFCDDLPIDCANTAQCPLGHACVPATCPPSTHRCVPLCA